MLNYKLVERGKPGDATVPKKLYATHVSKGRKNFNHIAVDITDMSSLTRGDIESVFKNIVDQVPKYLLDGQTVSLGELGSLRLTLSSEGALTEGEFNVGMIKNVRIIFTPGKMLKDAIAKATFQRL